MLNNPIYLNDEERSLALPVVLNKLGGDLEIYLGSKIGQVGGHKAKVFIEFADGQLRIRVIRGSDLLFDEIVYSWYNTEVAPETEDTDNGVPL